MDPRDILDMLVIAQRMIVFGVNVPTEAQEHLKVFYAQLLQAKDSGDISESSCPDGDDDDSYDEDPHY